MKIVVQSLVSTSAQGWRSIYSDVLGDRFILTHEAEAQLVTTDAIIKKSFSAVPML